MSGSTSPDGQASTGAKAAQVGADRFSERLWAPWWWWLAAVVATALVGREIQLAVRALDDVWVIVGYAAVAALSALVIWSMSRMQIRVTSAGELVAARARLPREVIARGASVPASAKSAALGRQLDPAAYLVHRSFVRTMVLLVLDDPDDPTPYWLVSTRRPAALLAALDLPDAAVQPRTPMQASSADAADQTPHPTPETPDSQV